jgi:hypothetical protein
VSKSSEHQRRAAECLRLAHEARDQTNKTLLLEMAQTWIKLAEQKRATEQIEPSEPQPGSLDDDS